MSVHRIPVSKLSPQALQGVIEECISRKGTDYGDIEVSMETKFRHVKYRLQTGSAMLIFEISPVLLQNE
jgi:hypothetical protein